MNSGLFQGGDRDQDILVADNVLRFSVGAIVNKQCKKRALITSGWRSYCSGGSRISAGMREQKAQNDRDTQA
jgi:hypothetical protein